MFGKTTIVAVMLASVLVAGCADNKPVVFKETPQTPDTVSITFEGSEESASARFQSRGQEYVFHGTLADTTWFPIFGSEYEFVGTLESDSAVTKTFTIVPSKAPLWLCRGCANWADGVEMNAMLQRHQ